MSTKVSERRGWQEPTLSPGERNMPSVVVLSGIARSEIVDAALGDPVLAETLVIRAEPNCEPPCDAVLWRVEAATGESPIDSVFFRRHWHRAPFALTLRLIQYAPNSLEPTILDEGTMGTRGPYAAFKAAVERLAMRLLRDVTMQRARGASPMPAAQQPLGPPGWLNALAERWRNRLSNEWWSVGTVPGQPEMAVTGLGKIEWFRNEAGNRYLADPFPWPGTNKILCEEMPLAGGVGRIVAITPIEYPLSPPVVLLEDADHYSYPCTFRDDESIYCVPENTRRGATHIFRLGAGRELAPVTGVAPHARLADPTLFKWRGLYWLGCTDLDLGEHDNLCLLFASDIRGPWTAHTRWPVKIDIRGARCGGGVFETAGRLFRVGQDCSATYGAAVVVHEILMLDETNFREVPVNIIRPDPNGPFPHGIHTLTHDGERFWVDGKRLILDLGRFPRRIAARLRHSLARTR